MKTEDCLKFLGMEVIDKVSGFRGVVTSISFDLYGCIQAIVHPKVNEKNEKPDGHYFDISRLTAIGDQPVMRVPSFVKNYKEDVNINKGPTERPAHDKIR